MSKLKDHIAIKAIMLLLVAVIFTPTAIKFAHVFEHHEHEVCIGGKSEHIHKVDLDCEFLKFPLSNNKSLTSYSIDLFSEKEPLSEIESLYVFLSKYQQLHFSLRGPPAINLI
ncbi:hypothetical protein E1J38_013640 [Seonamhaeicola sediminis]|uniref:Uncharacterized protein n=1 Tax=Seonamhaeicola sediminis TaxID=2528206 RepID=A0A562YAY7_9FLAO|nr:hypothetical protein [Seonamhaeicola sediminis]TWO31452.1 hypothetical protein E1J38_013640 [Seonamhaeicola sediminis]